MGANLNRVILVGNLTRDPEVRRIGSGTAVCDIGLAINDRRKGQNGEWVEETTFVDVTLWERTAEVAGEYLTKGSSVLIEGRLKLESWQSKEGEKRTKLKVIAERMQMLGGKGEGGGGGGGERSERGGYSRGGAGAARGNAGGGRAAPQNDYSDGPDYSDMGSRGGAAEDDIPF